MKYLSTIALVACLISTPAVAGVKVKTRLDHLAGTPLVLVISTIPEEITSVTCDDWKMMGMGSWKDHNTFTIPAAPKDGVSIAILDASKFDGYCKTEGSIKAHTDEGDYVGHLDGGPGKWSSSTKLTFDKP